MPSGAAAVTSTPTAPDTPAALAHSPGSLLTLPTRALAEFARAWPWLFNLLQNKNVFYSIKTFAAAMLAVHIAFSLDLTQPGWAFMTVYIVSQPYSGMVLSKSFARIAGTLAGALMSVILLALFHNVPPLFVLSIALWIGACLYFSIHMRDAPGSYGAMLAGYTTAIIGFSTITAPAAIFDTVTGRCLEIILAICVATLVSRVVLPRSSGRVFRYRVAASLADMKKNITGILANHYDDTRALADLRKLLADALALESLRIHATRDTAAVREAADLVRAIQGRILSLSSLLVSLHDRLILLRKDRPAAAAQLAPLFQRVSARIDQIASAAKPTDAMLAGTAATPGAAAPTRNQKLETRNSPTAPGITTELLSRLPDYDTVKRDPELVLEYNILLRLLDILAQWQEVNRLAALLFSDNLAGAANIPAPPPEDTQITNYRDHSLALVSAIGAIISVMGVTAFWIGTGWPNGAGAATFAGVVACTTATQDDPASRAMRTLRGSLLAALWSIIFLYAILPQLDTFGGLVAVLALIYVPAGILIPHPRHGAIVYMALIYGASFLGLHNIMEPNFADTINADAALITGMLAAIAGFRLLRPVGTEWPLRRHISGMFRDIAQLATMTGPINRSTFETRMLDRTNAVMLRLRLDNPDERERLRGVLTATRLGLNIRALARWQPDMPPPLAASVRAALDALASHCDQLARHPNATPAESPLPSLDHAIHRALDTAPGERDQTLNILVSLRAIRTTLTTHAKFYRVPSC